MILKKKLFRNIEIPKIASITVLGTKFSSDWLKFKLVMCDWPSIFPKNTPFLQSFKELPDPSFRITKNNQYLTVEQYYMSKKNIFNRSFVFFSLFATRTV